MKVHQINIEPSKTYASRANAVKAVEKVYGPHHEHFGSADAHYLVVQNEQGRWFPVFIGERSLQHMVHHRFAVAA